MREPIRFSAIVAILDEARYLEACLRTLDFCDEILVFDLGSRDAGPEIARRCGATLRPWPRVPIVEMLRCEVAALARNDWLVFVDPDEEYPAGIGDALRAAIEDNPRAAQIGLPTDYHFKGRKVEHTRYGRLTKFSVCHRQRVKLLPRVHKGIEELPGFDKFVVGDRARGMAIRHHWRDSWAEVFEHGFRYAEAEGASFHAAGLRFRPWPALRHVLGTLKRNLWDLGGLRGGPLAIALSFYSACYVALSWRSLRRYEAARSSAPRSVNSGESVA